MSAHRSSIVATLFLALFILFAAIAQTAVAGGRALGGEEGVDLIVVEFNCENLFDCRHDSLKDDVAFLPDGENIWTHARYWKKINNIARMILACGEQADGTCAIPDIVALCEVENDSVMRDLTRRSLLRNAAYEYVMTDSPDLRGIDVALLYSPMTFRVVDSHPIRVTPLKDMRPTRDILYIKGRTASRDTLHLFVVHAPSRSGGEMETRSHRRLVADAVAQRIDSLHAIDREAKIMVMGDFNDYDGDRSLRLVANHGMRDVSKNAKGSHGAKGTYKYRGEWGSLDHIFLSDNLVDAVVDCRIADPEFVLEKDNDYGGVKPWRNMLGTMWRNGYSDHLPLVLRLRMTVNGVP